jgi:hypothetical protein
MKSHLPKSEVKMLSQSEKNAGTHEEAKKHERVYSAKLLPHNKIKRDQI